MLNCNQESPLSAAIRRNSTSLRSLMTVRYTESKQRTSARLQPVAGKKAGDLTEFSGPFLFNTTLHEVP
jgi:hypothetical protein